MSLRKQQSQNSHTMQTVKAFLPCCSPVFSMPQWKGSCLITKKKQKKEKHFCLKGLNLDRDLNIKSSKHTATESCILLDLQFYHGSVGIEEVQSLASWFPQFRQTAVSPGFPSRLPGTMFKPNKLLNHTARLSLTSTETCWQTALSMARYRCQCHWPIVVSIFSNDLFGKKDDSSLSKLESNSI